MAATTTVDVHEYKEGSLVIDLVDAERKALIWQGVGTSTLKKKSNGREERINEAVSKILAAYPPK